MSREALELMNAQLVHRGPDDGGEWVSADGRAGLANRRLAIIDLSPAGHQPMLSADQRYAIAFNGEIYNYLEVRSELCALGHRFASESDTEVLLTAFRHWGADCLPRLNGMFAFAVWDSVEGRLFAARDRFGEKPFYYTAAPGQFAFASEIKSLLALPWVSRRADHRAIARYIGLALVDGEPGTFFEGIRQLPPAHYLMLDGDGRVTLTRYWDVNVDAHECTLPEAERTARFRELFVDAVRLRLRSDVAVGSSLSGGLDSSSIVCAINALRAPDSPPQNTFSARHESAAVDEGRYMERVVAHTGATPHDVWVKAGDLAADIDRFVWHQDEPVAHTSQFAQWKVMELAKTAGVTVLLDGQGADETIGGYPSPTFGYRFAELFRGGEWAGLVEELGAFKRVQGSLGLGLRFLGASVLPQRLRAGARARFHATSGLLPGASAGLEEPRPAHRTLRRALHHIMTVSSLPSLLRYGDRNSMAFSREARLPFLDHRLVEFVFSLPSRDLVGGGVTKRVLRAAMRGLVPEVVLDRTDKIGFATPERDWMLGTARAWMANEVAAA
ncbi:MAG TPA: asparagine synthase (glutamine-hydrolyzing), partial [Vicinamibacterales bacterium]|nr:asparagine synthase (glutamine-hydrolyzing) [Vicinamibacterales bacterium]